MTYRKYFSNDDPDGPQQFYDSIAGPAASRTMGRDEKGAFVEYSTQERKMWPCRHLDYSLDSYGQSCELQAIEGMSCPVRFWHRKNVPYAEAPRNVQFCAEGRGRINGIFQCYNPGEMSCYEQEIIIDDSGFIDIGRLPLLPIAIALVAGYAIHFMAMH